MPHNILNAVTRFVFDTRGRLQAPWPGPALKNARRIVAGPRDTVIAVCNSWVQSTDLVVYTCEGEFLSCYTLPYAHWIDLSVTSNGTHLAVASSDRAMIHIFALKEDGYLTEVAQWKFQFSIYNPFTFTPEGWIVSSEYYRLRVHDALTGRTQCSWKFNHFLPDHFIAVQPDYLIGFNTKRQLHGVKYLEGRMKRWHKRLGRKKCSEIAAVARDVWHDQCVVVMSSDRALWFRAIDGRMVAQWRFGEHTLYEIVATKPSGHLVGKSRERVCGIV